MNGGAEAGFELDPRLAADTVFVDDWRLCRVLLMDDARFPWLVLVPRRADITELDQLGGDDATRLMAEILRVTRMLRAAAACDKLNVGALGNIVRQLHVHVVARCVGDAAWPGPVWGHGSPRRYPPGERTRMLARLASMLGNGDTVIRSTRGPQLRQ